VRPISLSLTAGCLALVLGSCIDAPVAPTTATGPGDGGPVAAAPTEGPRNAAAEAGSLRWHGYVSGVTDEALRGTASYSNFGYVVTTADSSSTYVGGRIRAMRPYGMKAIIQLGNLLWCGQGQLQLCTGWEKRLSIWKAKNADELNSNDVLAMFVRDEAFTFGVNPVDLERASRTVRDTFPWAKLIHVEYYDQARLAHSPYRQDTIYKTVDWVGVDVYGIHPQGHTGLRDAIAGLKIRHPGAKIVYVSDAFWNAGHRSAIGSIENMAGIAKEWYDVARADPDAVLLGQFIWGPVEPTDTVSREFPPVVLQEHTRIGRLITGKSRTTAYAATGALDPVRNSGQLLGTACDPDGAWGETVVVDVYSNGSLIATTNADRYSGPSVIAPCRNGLYHRFVTSAGGQPLGRDVVAKARDLNGGSYTLELRPWAEVGWVQPSGVTWGPPNTLTAAGWGRNGGTGGVQMRWRDATTGSAWSTVAWQPVPVAADATWSNTVPVSNYCHDYEVTAAYGGYVSTVFRYRGLSSGHCNEQAQVTWIQPQAQAGFGPPGSLVVAGSASGAPAGTTVTMFWRDVTAGTGVTQAPYSAPVDAGGTWYNTIPNADYTHRYAVYVKYDVKQSTTCTYQGTGGITWC
jgi:hypothetical protein